MVFEWLLEAIAHCEEDRESCPVRNRWVVRVVLVFGFLHFPTKKIVKQTVLAWTCCILLRKIGGLGKKGELLLV